MSESILLEMNHIRKVFPGVVALKDVSIQLHAGEVHALLGENGAGKSTLIKVLAGIYNADSGEIRINGKPVIIESVLDAQKNGISVIHQELVLVSHMTVAENIYLGREPVTCGGLVDYKKMNRGAKAILDSFEMDIDSEDKIARLTIGQQQMVEIIKALSFNAKILVMDEPTSSLSEKGVSFLFDTIKKLKEFIRGIFVDKAKELSITRKYVDGMGIKTPTYSQLAGNLSGSNQQKVVIGRWLATSPKILIMDEPTKGVDVRAKAEIYVIMNNLVRQGVSIIMISSELPEVINMSDRVVVINGGQVAECLPREGLTQEKIMQYATQLAD